MVIQSLGAILQSIHAAGLSDLDLYQGAQPGDIAFVDTLKCNFAATPSHLTTADGYLVRDGYNVQWQRILGSTSAYWLGQNTWYVDPTNGNDENDGYTSLTALKTPNEIQRRWGSGNPTAAVTITFLGNVTTATFTSVGNITIVGTSTTLVTTTLSTWNAVNTTYANQEVNTLTAAGISDWTPYIGKVLNFGANGVARVATASPKGVGLSTARASAPIVPNPLNVTPTPTVSQSFTVQSLTTIGTLTIPNCYTLQDLSIGNLNIVPSYSSYLILMNCDITSTASSSPMFMCGGTLSVTAYYIVTGLLYNVLNINNLGLGQNVVVSRMLSQGGQIGASAVLATIYYLAIFDVPANGTAPAMTLNFATIYLRGYLMGVNATLLGLVLYESSKIYYIINSPTSEAAPTLRGASYDWADLDTGVYLYFTWANTPYRCFNHAQGQATLTPGSPSSSVTVSLEGIHSDAIIQPTYATPSGTTGTLSVSNITATSFKINSSSTNDSSVVNWTMSVPMAGDGGIFIRGAAT